MSHFKYTFLNNMRGHKLFWIGGVDKQMSSCGGVGVSMNRCPVGVFNTNKTLEQKVKANVATSLHFIERS